MNGETEIWDSLDTRREYKPPCAPYSVGVFHLLRHVTPATCELYITCSLSHGNETRAQCFRVVFVPSLVVRVRTYQPTVEMGTSYVSNTITRVHQMFHFTKGTYKSRRTILEFYLN